MRDQLGVGGREPGVGGRETGVGGRESEAGRINSFRDLRVWQAGMDIVEEVYRLTQNLPAAEQYGLVSQMRRAAVSFPANIAEGYVRESTREYLQHLSISQGSPGELETHVEIAIRLGYLGLDVGQRLLSPLSALQKQLFRLRDALRSKLELTPNSQLPTPAEIASC